MVVVSLRPAYAGVRMTAWWVLWFTVHFDAFLNRKSRGRGWRLHRGILAFLTTEIVYQTIHLAIVVQYANSDSFNFTDSSAFKAEIFFGWLAQSVFLCLILLVSAGYCILRDRLGEHLKKVIIIPILYGVTSMVFDYILLSTSNDQVITQQSDRVEDDGIDSNDFKVLGLVVCLLVKAVVFVSAWIFVFEHLNRELRLLRGEKEESEDIPETENDETGEYTRPELQNAVETQNGEDVAEGEETKTMADAIGDQAKLLLLTRFRSLLIVYIISIICSCLPPSWLVMREMCILVVNILPIYIGNSSVEKIQSVITVCENLILFGFVAGLSIIFRPVGDNPYLLLVDDLEGEEEGKEVTTELGVISFEPPTPQQTTTILSEPKKFQGREQPSFALADEDDMEFMSPKGQGAENPSSEASFTPKLDPVPSNEQTGQDSST